VDNYDVYLKGMKMETKRIVAGVITVLVFTGVIICPAIARKYDTMMVGADRWIDTNANQRICEQPNEIVARCDTNDKATMIAYFQDEDYDEPNEITYYDGQVEPNLIVLIYHPDEHPEHPNDIIYEGDLEPNLATLIDSSGEHPEHPNDISIEAYHQNMRMVNLQAEHPEDPNDLSSQEDIDPNDIEKIILDEGTANQRKEDSILPELS
jgi:hypothetical protein